MSLSSLTRMEQFLLMAAAVHGYGPDADITRANTHVIVWQVVQWAGLDTPEVADRWGAAEWHPLLGTVYDPLVRMVHQVGRSGPERPPERPGEALFEGGGNWGVPGNPDHGPCNPRFNACRLTRAGARLAMELLEQHPEYQRGD